MLTLASASDCDLQCMLRGLRLRIGQSDSSLPLRMTGNQTFRMTGNQTLGMTVRQTAQ